MVPAIYGRTFDHLVCAAVADCNGGSYPKSLREWRGVARCAGIRRIQFVSRRIVPSPILRFDKNRTSAVLYLPLPKTRRQLYFWLLHEVGEKLMGMEIAPPVHYPADWGDHHAIACAVENCQRRATGCETL